MVGGGEEGLHFAFCMYEHDMKIRDTNNMRGKETLNHGCPLSLPDHPKDLLPSMQHFEKQGKREITRALLVATAIISLSSFLA